MTHTYNLRPRPSIIKYFPSRPRRASGERVLLDFAAFACMLLLYVGLFRFFYQQPHE
jgi:hypothetical protein